MEYMNPYDLKNFEDYNYQHVTFQDDPNSKLARKRSNALERKASLARRASQKKRANTPTPGRSTTPGGFRSTTPGGFRSTTPGGFRSTTPTPGNLTAVSEKDGAEVDELGEKEKNEATVTVEEDDEDAKYSHLSESEKQILKEQVDIPDDPINFKTLYRYATRTDMIVVGISAFCAIAGGSALPLMNVVFGQIAGTFQGLNLGTVDRATFPALLSQYTLYFVYLAIAEFITIYIATAGFIYTGDHITNAIRQEYLKALFRQNIAFFDTLGAGEVTTRITADSNLIQEAISEKVGLALTGFSTFITVFIVGFFFFWKLTLICASVIVAIVVTMGGGSGILVGFSKKSLALYGIGGSVAEEVLSSIRIAVAFGLQKKLGGGYEAHLKMAFKWGFRAKVTLACMMGSVFCFIYLTYGLAFWMGSRFLVSGEVDLAHILTIIMSIIIGSMSIGTVALNAEAFGSGVAAAQKIFNTIDRNSPINPMSTEGHKLDHVEGVVRLEHIKHIYPSRPDVVVSEDLSLFIPAGKTTALVGPSGSGKSTIIGLLQRYYNPVSGSVYLDGHDIKDLNLSWLRSQIAMVQQEPILFATTIMENIAYGLVGSKFEFDSPKEKEARIINAAKMANAHDFITQFPEGYNTHVGERGFLLSGGQKQRVSIARAIVSDPKILLLDEATSALDSQSESIVQAALDAAARGRTTIVIAHRLATIKNADNIVVMKKGKIAEQGDHDELLELQGTYYDLVQAQNIGEGTQSSAAPPAYDTKRRSKSESTAPRNPFQEDVSTMGGEELDDVESQSDLVLKSNMMDGSTLAPGTPNAEVAPPKRTEQTYSLWTLIRFIASYNKPDWPFMLLGLFFSMIAGCGQPLQGIFFSKAIESLSLPLKEKSEIRSEVDFWCLMYLGLGFLQLFSIFGENASLAHCSEKLILRARDHAFRTMLRQDIAFYDEKENEVGALTSFLSTETTHLAGISGATLGTLLSSMTTLVASIIVAVVIGWKLALVCMCAMPVLLGCGFCRFKILAKFQSNAQRAYGKSASYACENINAIRTVASLTREQSVLQTYTVQVNSHGKSSLFSNLRSSTLYAASESAVFLCIALGFWYGGNLILHREYTLFQFFVCFSEVIFGAQAAGTVFSFAGDMGKAKSAAERLKNLSDRPISIDAESMQGRKLDGMSGTIEFKDVHFRYPTRPTQPILRGLDLTIKPGQFAALVGGSGCGKSTIIQLIERFYDPTYGSVQVDHQDISRLRVDDYRSYIGLVSQEPTLYAGSVRENILLGAEGQDISEAQLMQACKEANIYDFVMSLPEGFDTKVGNKAALLSGGQKQRIAIARALIRNPKILLLDEATSALDSESEKVVQAALDIAAKGRTTIAVVHRLSSIKNADVIYVLDQGTVLEAGTHNELMALGGRYKTMVIAQNLDPGNH